MGWFGSSDDDKSKSSSSSSSSYDSVSSFGGDSGDFAAPGGSFAGGGVGGGDFQDQAVQLSQQAMIQALMFKLTERGFEQCVSKPSSSLSSSEQSCIKALTSKYMESSAYIMQRLQRQQK